jgi:hypothetical protein
VRRVFLWIQTLPGHLAFNVRRELLSRPNEQRLVSFLSKLLNVLLQKFHQAVGELVVDLTNGDLCTKSERVCLGFSNVNDGCSSSISESGYHSMLKKLGVFLPIL